MPTPGSHIKAQEAAFAGCPFRQALAMASTVEVSSLVGCYAVLLRSLIHYIHLGSKQEGLSNFYWSHEFLVSQVTPWLHWGKDLGMLVVCVCVCVW